MQTIYRFGVTFHSIFRAINITSIEINVRKSLSVKTIKKPQKRKKKVTNLLF